MGEVKLKKIIIAIYHGLLAASINSDCFSMYTVIFSLRSACQAIFKAVNRKTDNQKVIVNHKKSQSRLAKMAKRFDRELTSHTSQRCNDHDLGYFL